MCSIFSIFFFKLKHTSKIISFPFPLSTITFGVVAPSFCSSLPFNYTGQHHRVRVTCHLPSPSSGWSNLMVCTHRLMGMISSHKMHMTKTSACFTNALQHLYPAPLNTARTWHTIEALLGMTGIRKIFNVYCKVACTKSSPEISVLGKLAYWTSP